MDWYNAQLTGRYETAPLPTYFANQFDQMIAETKPDTVIVSSMDSTHTSIHHPRHGFGL